MYKLLQLLFIGHVHDYSVIRESRLTDEFGAVGTRLYLQCSKCGNVKKKDII